MRQTFGGCPRSYLPLWNCLRMKPDGEKPGVQGSEGEFPGDHIWVLRSSCFWYGLDHELPQYMIQHSFFLNWVSFTFNQRVLVKSHEGFLDPVAWHCLLLWKALAWLKSRLENVQKLTSASRLSSSRAKLHEFFFIPFLTLLPVPRMLWDTE